MSENEWINIFGDNLKDILRECDMTQRDLAREMGVEESTISSYIHKRKMISTKNLINMSQILCISIDELANFDSMVN